MTQQNKNNKTKTNKIKQIRSRRLKRVGLWSVRSLSKSIVGLIEQLNGAKSLGDMFSS